MDAKRATTISKFLSLVLRHDPAAASLTLDAGGWAEVDALLRGAAAAGVDVTRDELERVVRDSDKQRFSLSDDGRRIRANQGHSVPVNLGLVPSVPPDVLYHGTVARSLDAIRREGLRPMERQHVHLSPNVDNAAKVGQRRGQPVVLTIDAARLHADGGVFYLSVNGVWLTDAVPPAYIATSDERDVRT